MSQEIPVGVLRREWLKCAESPAYFVMQYLYVYSPHGTGQGDGPGTPEWVPFHLWPAQVQALCRMHRCTRLVILKARQLGLSWLALAYALWKLVFGAPATVLLFSLREDEAVELLGRLKGMYRRLQQWQQACDVVQDSRTVFELSTGSRALAFSTRGGRSYTGTLAIVDEADYVPNLDQFLNAVKPTIDGGGQLFLISTSDKRRPVSTFKNLFRAAGVEGVPGAGLYERLFLPWSAHPGRDAGWSARTKAEMYAQRGTDDDFFAEYPATPEEALAPEQHDRRIPFEWLDACMKNVDPVQTPSVPTLPALPGLVVYREPVAGRSYVIGADPAEGNPHSDDSVATVLDVRTWEECAVVAGKTEPTVFAGYVGQLAEWYNEASILPERNNHGHTVIAALREAGRRVLIGYDGKPGWLSNVKGKALLYNALADAVRDGACVIHCAETASQIASIEASSLRAPQGLHDDYADSFALAIVGALDPFGRAMASHVSPAVDPLKGIDGAGW
jgi:hypothetical protein